MGVLVARVRGLQLPAADPAWRHRPQAPEPRTPGPRAGSDLAEFWALASLQHRSGPGHPPGTRLAKPMEFSFALKMRVRDFTREKLVRQ